MPIRFGLRSYSTKVHLIVISPNQNNMQESSCSARRSHLATNERRAVTQRQMRQLIPTQASRRFPNPQNTETAINPRFPTPRSHSLTVGPPSSSRVRFWCQDSPLRCPVTTVRS